MKKIGILTEYYKNYNYGGILQAYALCKVIQALGYECEQIQYKKEKDIETFEKSLKGFLRFILNKLKLFIMHFVYGKRTQFFDYFMQEKIKHSKDVYDDNTITQTIDKYDIFVVGSDQVWNPNLFNKSYFLEFVPENKIKLSYAASLSVFELSEDQKNFLKNCLKGYKAISVREKNAVELLTNLTDKKVQWVLDPTLLLSKEEWNILSSGRTPIDKYVFTYFLGSGRVERKLAEEYAKIKGLKIVSMPLVFGWKSGFDNNFGDIRLFDVSPEDFISLIKNAETIFTDSFHAVVFSHIFEKNFYVFKRSDHLQMAARLYNITDLFGTQNHFCDTEDKLNVKYLLDNQDLKIDYSMYRIRKKVSLEFLDNNLQ